jgi:predicted transcriptional regulator
MIAAAGPTSVSEEMTLPSSPPAVQKWLADSYTPAKYLAAWEETFHVYADAFPNQCVSLAGPSLPILEHGRMDRPAHLRARQEIVDQAMRAFGRRLAIQSNDLHAGHAEVEAPDYTDFINSYSGRIITGFEMRGGSQGPIPSKVMGAEGDPPLALRRSIDKGMARNNAGRHVNFLQIYAGDVLPPDMQPVLRYAASLFGRR